MSITIIWIDSRAVKSIKGCQVSIKIAYFYSYKNQRVFFPFKLMAITDCILLFANKSFCIGKSPILELDSLIIILPEALYFAPRALLLVYLFFFCWRGWSHTDCGGRIQFRMSINEDEDSNTFHHVSGRDPCQEWFITMTHIAQRIISFMLAAIA